MRRRRRRGLGGLARGAWGPLWAYLSHVRISASPWPTAARTMAAVSLALFVASWCCALAATPETATITSGVLFNDTDGNPLHAHGAGIVVDEGKFYLVGTTQKLPPTWLSKGVNLYSSDDLEHWDFVAEIFHTAHLPALATRLERPKILYNRLTNKYVMWFHMDDAAFSMGMVGVATAERIDGPYTYLAGWRPDGLRSLDMTIVQLDDSAYLVRSVDNQYSGFSRLTADFLNTTVDGILTKGPRCEGNSLWAEAGAIYMLCSHLTGWHANPAILVRSDTPSITRNTTVRASHLFRASIVAPPCSAACAPLGNGMRSVHARACACACARAVDLVRQPDE